MDEPGTDYCTSLYHTLSGGDALCFPTAQTLAHQIYNMVVPVNLTSGASKQFSPG